MLLATGLGLSGSLAPARVQAAQDTPASGEPAVREPDGAPQVGDMAPRFTLKTLEGDGEVALETFAGKRPVVLFFGSYT